MTQFTDHDFTRWAVSADFRGGDEWSSTGLGFEDYSRMHTETQNKPIARRKPCPAWALNNEQLAQIIVRMMEARAHFRRPQTGTLTERMKRAEDGLRAQIPRLLAILDSLLVRFKTAKDMGLIDVAHATEQKIEEVDTRIKANQNFATLLAGITYYYHRCGMDSVEVGQRLKIKPPHVRQTIWRLDWTAGLLGFGPRMKIHARTAEQKAAALAARELREAARRARASRAVERKPAALKSQAAECETLPTDPTERQLANWIVNQRRRGVPWDEIKKEIGDRSPHTHKYRALVQRYGLVLPNQRRDKQ